jgi:hypothetical protein
VGWFAIRTPAVTDISIALSDGSCDGSRMRMSRSRGDKFGCSDREKATRERRQLIMKKKEVELEQRLRALQAELEFIRKESADLERDLSADDSSSSSTGKAARGAARAGFGALRNVTVSQARLQAGDTAATPERYENTAKLRSVVSRQVVGRDESQDFVETNGESVHNDDGDESEFFYSTDGYEYEEPEADSQPVAEPGGANKFNAQRLVCMPTRNVPTTTNKVEASGGVTTTASEDLLDEFDDLVELECVSGRYRERVFKNAYDVDGALRRFLAKDHHEQRMRLMQQQQQLQQAATKPLPTPPTSLQAASPTVSPSASNDSAHQDIPDGTQVQWRKPEVRESLAELVRALGRLKPK